MTPSRPLARRARTAALLLLGLLAVGCGVEPQSQARRIAADDVPFDLLEAPTSSSPAAVGRSVVIYLVRDDRLVGVDRTLDPSSSLVTVLDALSDGPTTTERALGIGSPLPPGQIDAVDTVRGVAEVDLAASFGDLSTEDQAMAIGQIVYTLTGRPGIGRVSFTLDGDRIEVPGGDGALTRDALSRDDFPDLAPR